MVTIATFDELTKAKHLKERLQAAGLTADVHNEGHLQQLAFMSKPHANATVAVEERDFERAHQLLLEWEKSDPEMVSAIRCPQCGSPRIQYPQLSRKFIVPGLAALFLALRLFQKEFYCQDCHYTWPKEGES